VCVCVSVCVLNGCVLNVIIIVECGGFHGEGPQRADEGMRCPETDVGTERKRDRVMGQM